MSLQSAIDHRQDGGDRVLGLRFGQFAQGSVEQQAGQAVDSGPGCVLGPLAALRRQRAYLDEFVEPRTEEVVRVGGLIGLSRSWRLVRLALGGMRPRRTE